MPEQKKDNYEKPGLNPLGNGQGALSENDLKEVTGGGSTIVSTDCASGNGNTYCRSGESAFGGGSSCSGGNLASGCATGTSAQY